MKNLIIDSNNSIRESLKLLGKSGNKCLIVADEDTGLMGTLSDGDLRKAILRGANVSDPISNIYQSKPTVLVQGEYNLRQVKELFINNKFDLIPIIDKKRKVVDVLLWEEVFKSSKKRHVGILDLPVVIMAGGKGTRMEPFTKVLPKPLIPIHEKPVIEHIIERFTNVGVNQFIFTVNYKASIMKAFLEELDPHYSVEFIEESKPLGTAGSLKFLENKFDKPLMVTNCDIIIKADYLDLFAFHQNNAYDITLVASVKNYTIPYGTCELNEEGHLEKIHEKPEYDFLVNTGLYVINPNVLKLIPNNKLYNITHLIEEAQKIGQRVGVYPIDDEAWIDVGQWAEYQKAVDQL